VTNLALDVGGMIPKLADELGMAPLVPLNLRTVDGPWADQVRLHTVSKISKRVASASFLRATALDTAGSSTTSIEPSAPEPIADRLRNGRRRNP